MPSRDATLVRARQGGETRAETGPSYHRHVGVDIAADTFTVAWLPAGGTPTMLLPGDRSPARYRCFQQRLMTTGVAPAETLVVVETTGNDWVALAGVLHLGA